MPKNILPKFQTITDGDMSQATLTSAVTNIQNLDNIGIQLNFTGTPTGTFDVQVSIDNTNFISLGLSPAPAASGSASQIYIDLNGLSAPYIRTVYTKTSGTGTLNAFICGKGV